MRWHVAHHAFADNNQLSMDDTRGEKIMKHMNTILCLALAVACIAAYVSPTRAFAAEGNNANCTNSTGTGCTTGMSATFLDATPFASTTVDICTTLFNIINAGTFVGGTVIDARGLTSTNSKLTCTASTTDTPWVQNTASTTKASTILLPPGTIMIAYSWALPNMTRVIGEGAGATALSATVLQATSNISSGFMVQLGASCPTAGCTGVSVENLTLHGNGVAGVGGITNSASHELSYVRQVNLFGIAGTGLQITTGSTNSGPYSGLTFTAAAATSVCAAISGPTTTTRGIHGLTCTGNSFVPTNAVTLDAPNNSLEDIRITGFTNGITVGGNAAVQSASLLNIVGGTSMTNVVNISNAHPVTDFAIMGVFKNGATNAIQDQETLPASKQLINDTSVGLYVIGEQMGTAAAYSKFTTSPNANAVTWSTGTAALTASSACPSTGSMYSNTHGGANTTWYVCTGNHWTDIK